MTHIVTIDIGKACIERDEYGRSFGPDSCKVALIRLYKALKDCGLKEAKDAVEAVHAEPRHGHYDFVLNDAELGRLYLFLRENHSAIVERNRTGYQVLELRTLRKGVL